MLATMRNFATELVMKRTSFEILFLIIIGLSFSEVRSFGPNSLDGGSFNPCCTSTWNVSQCECRGRPWKPSMLCNSVRDSSDLNRTFEANKEKEYFLAIEIHGSPLNSLPLNVLPPYVFQRFLLSNNSIHTVDKDAFKEDYAQVIRLDGNKLTSFPFEALTGMNYLQLLEIQNNQLTTIPINALPSSENLETLNLSSNKISSIGKNAFSRLPGLKQLELSYNQLTSLGERTFSIDQQKQPLTLFLSNNKIQKIEDEAFDGLKIDRLNLDNNKLTILNEDTFQSLLRDGTEISVEENSFDCYGIRMMWIKNLPVTMKQKLSGFKCSKYKRHQKLLEPLRGEGMRLPRSMPIFSQRRPPVISDNRQHLADNTSPDTTLTHSGSGSPSQSIVPPPPPRPNLVPGSPPKPIVHPPPSRPSFGQDYQYNP